MVRRLLAATGIAVALGACATPAEIQPPVLRVRRGPAASRPVHRVVATRATCGSFSSLAGDAGAVASAPCSPDAVRGVDELVRAALEFRGYDVLDAEAINAVTAARSETTTERSDRPGATRSSVTTVEEGSRFEDRTPLEQTAILRKLGADGVVSTRIWIGARAGAMSMERTATVQVTLAGAADGALVWSRRCDLLVGGLTATDAVAMEHGARCAMAGDAP